MDINKLFGECLEELQAEGKVKELMKSQLETTIKKTFGDLFGEWGKFRDMLKKALEEEVQLNLEKVDLVTWNEVLNKLISDQLAAELPSMLNPMTKTIREVVGKLEKDTYTLSEVVEKFKESVHQEDNSIYEIEFELEETSYGSRWLKLGTGQKKSRGVHEWRFLLSTDKAIPNHGCISAYSFNGDYWGPINNKNFMTNPQTGFGLFVFKLYASQCQIKLNDCHINTYIGED